MEVELSSFNTLLCWSN